MDNRSSPSIQPSISSSPPSIPSFRAAFFPPQFHNRMSEKKNIEPTPAPPFVSDMSSRNAFAFDLLRRGGRLAEFPASKIFPSRKEGSSSPSLTISQQVEEFSPAEIPKPSVILLPTSQALGATSPLPYRDPNSPPAVGPSFSARESANANEISETIQESKEAPTFKTSLSPSENGLENEDGDSSILDESDVEEDEDEESLLLSEEYLEEESANNEQKSLPPSPNLSVLPIPSQAFLTLQKASPETPWALIGSSLSKVGETMELSPFFSDVDSDSGVSSGSYQASLHSRVSGLEAFEPSPEKNQDPVPPESLSSSPCEPAVIKEILMAKEDLKTTSQMSQSKDICREPEVRSPVEQNLFAPPEGLPSQKSPTDDFRAFGASPQKSCHPLQSGTLPSQIAADSQSQRLKESSKKSAQQLELLSCFSEIPTLTPKVNLQQVASQRFDCSQLLRGKISKSRFREISRLLPPSSLPPLRMYLQKVTKSHLSVQQKKNESHQEPLVFLPPKEKVFAILASNAKVTRAENCGDRL